MQKLKADQNIGPALRRLRKEKQLTQDMLVARLQTGYGLVYTRATYSRFETGELNIPISLLTALKDLYQCSYDDFFEGLRPGGREA